MGLLGMDERQVRGGGYFRAAAASNGLARNGRAVHPRGGTEEERLTTAAFERALGTNERQARGLMPGTSGLD
jgi:hypothetical protein